MKPPQYHIIETTQDHVLIQDVGPWDKHATITNAAEKVVAELSPLLFDGRRLEYIDSDGNRGQLLVKDGQFAGFAPPNPPQEPPAPSASAKASSFNEPKAPFRDPPVAGDQNA